MRMLFSDDVQKENAISEFKHIAPNVLHPWISRVNRNKYEKWMEIVSSLDQSNREEKAAEFANLIVMNWSGKGISKNALKYRFDSEVLAAFTAELQRLIAIEFNQTKSFCW